MGSIDDNAVKKLNNVVKNCILETSLNKPTVYIHYSPMEHTYEDHIKDLIAELIGNGYLVIEDAEYAYSNHDDIAKYFPLYLLDVLAEIL